MCVLPRVGRVSYLNCLPVFYALEQGKVDIPGTVVAGPPVELNRALAEGELEVTAVSSFAYAQHFDKCLVLPGLSISSSGPVKSVALFSKRPIQELEGQSISLTPYSATSVALLEVLLKRLYGVEARFFRRPPGAPLWWAPEGEEEPAAALAIGDEALQAWKLAGGLFVYDLGKEWYGFTGQPMVFALWVVREEFAREHPEKLKAIWQGLLASKAWGREHLAEVAQEAARLSGLSLGEMVEYFGVLEYDLGPEHIRGLKTFYRYCYEEGRLSCLPEIRIWERY
ncbi:MAG: menaquinone biosynthesis protein [Thermanaeromonas sp.]|uniref:menaquinone biosynthetic enzyme MqnA/MqnD family protein n=1 Tax=Thermanaeromonas sp. TaxID=2003697 RepID=UPI00243B4307|nr:menaquinone biosynthesis protein [Thermanaeromonas sp.]MCG0278201.1 menaquinone biosynthesis protein [Thermanaeromonas sp.]